MLPVFCIAQKKDSIFGDFVLTREYYDSTKTSYYTKLTPIQDTIACIMLVCDTAYNVKLYNRNVTWWQFGYMTREHYELWQDNFSTMPQPFPPIICLDKDKKPLPKSIIVWMSKELK